MKVATEETVQELLNKRTQGEPITEEEVEAVRDYKNSFKKLPRRHWEVCRTIRIKEEKRLERIIKYLGG